VLTLGSVRRDEPGDRDIIIADIPGLIEGASEGAGLGIRFLKHISRTAGLVFLIDLSGDNYRDAFDILYRELAQFSPALPEKSRIIAGTKLDLDDTAGRLEELKKKYPNEEVVGISVFSGEGITELAAARGRLVNTMASESAGAAGSAVQVNDGADILDEDFSIDDEVLQ
jgi:GTP-binding protein